jgi:hypothetical protein
MKKIALIVIIAALSTSMSVALALADDRDWRDWNPIKGEYAMIATGSCLHSPSGFKSTTPPFIPNNIVGVWGATTMAQATWVFKHGGKGTLDGVNYAIDFPPGNPLPLFSGPDARNSSFGFDITYVVDDSVITIKQFARVTPPFQTQIAELIGTVSEDGNTITIPSAYQFYQFGLPMGDAVCNTARTLIRVGD